jgi:hypothetical protein
MIDSNIDRWEERLREIASNMDYPVTPNMADAVRRRLADDRQAAVGEPWFTGKLAWAVAALLVAVGLLLAVPQARAAIVNFFHIGDIRLFPNKPMATPSKAAEATPSPATVSPTTTVTAERRLTADPALAGLLGQTSLAELEAELGGAMLLPSYPEGIGLPDAVYFQDEFGLLGIQAWFDTADEEKVWAVLYTLILNEGAYASKIHFQVDTLLEADVNGQGAYWVEAQHNLAFYDGEGQIYPKLTRLVEGNTLIWTVDEVTYRLETGLSLEEALRMAESMR